MQAQFLLQAPNSGDENNYRWYEASAPSTILGTDFFFEVTQPGVYFATYDGTLCGSNATGYFILTDCETPNNQVTLDIRDNVNGGATVSWSPVVTGDPLQPVVTATKTVVVYTASVIKAGTSTALPTFTLVCMSEAANLVPDTFVLNEDTPGPLPVFLNDTDLPVTGILSLTNPAHGSLAVNQNGSVNNPSDDIITYTPDADYRGPDTFDYTICNSFGDCSTALVTLDILPIVDALDDTVATDQDVAVLINVLANDNDIPVLGTLTATVAMHGNVALAGNGTPDDPSDDHITYSPYNGYTGGDSFTYTLCDTLGNCSTANITLIVNPAGADLDSDDDGILDNFEDLNLDGDNTPATQATDSDEDGIPDYLDIDSDNDGIPDNVEAQSTLNYLAPSDLDANGNGLDDAYEQGSIGLFPLDTDADSLPDYLDEDSDNDHITDAVEGHDYDHDGHADAAATGSDSDGDGLDDGYEGSVLADQDVNDETDNPLADLPDTDGDGIPDYRDTDDDGDGISTQDEDTNKDGDYSNDDTDRNGRPDYLEPNETGEVLEVFNVVTPNGDGIHDVLRIRGLEDYPNNTLRIYNRWGTMVYVTKAYNTQGNVFDGTSEERTTVNKDNKLPVGTYFYILDYEDENGITHTLSGYIYINR